MRNESRDRADYEALPANSVFRLLLDRCEIAIVPVMWRVGTNPAEIQLGECRPRAFQYVEEHADIVDIRLVFGTIVSPEVGGPIEHTWVSLPGGVVFDGVVQQFYAGESYCQLVEAVETISYTRSQAMDNFERGFGVPGIPLYGPWPE